MKRGISGGLMETMVVGAAVPDIIIEQYLEGSAGRDMEPSLAHRHRNNITHGEVK
jgi:hypothetical protein